MGGTSYSSDSRALRSHASGYYTKSRDDIFEQNKKRMIHESMEPKGVQIRESRDSEAHPNSIPIIITLDLTGSMGNIPHELVKNGLPKIMEGIIQHGIPDPQVLFLGVGDHECDRHPLQVSQFESGDAELDMWLTRTYIEGGGGGNGGESYGLAHYFAANHTVTDHWEKRGKKGFLFTIGDEPNLKVFPSNALKEITGNGDVRTFSDKEILEKAQEKWEVYHIIPGKETRGCVEYWKNLLGQNSIWVDSIDKIADTIRDIVISNTDLNQFLGVPPTKTNVDVTAGVPPTKTTADTPVGGSNIIL